MLEQKDSGVSGGTARMFVLCGFILLSFVASFSLLSLGTMEKHECFVSITAREMTASGNWFFPTCNGYPRLNKTPLQYWLVGGLHFITGHFDAFTARFPSAVFGFLSALAIFYATKRWLDFRTAVLAGCVWVTMFGFLLYSHNARPEMGLTFFVLVCFLSFWEAIHATDRKTQVLAMLIFWASLGLGMLAKGPAPLAYVFIPLAVYVALHRHWRIIPKLLPIVGTILFLAIVLPWPVYIGQTIHWDMAVWRGEYVGRLTGDFEKGDPCLYYYLLIMFKYATPWVAFLPMALLAPFYRVWKERQPLMKYLWLCYVANIIFLTINQGKRHHYLLPVMPLMAMLIGILLEDMVFQRKAYAKVFAVRVLRYHVLVMVLMAAIGFGAAAMLYPAMLVRIAVLCGAAAALVGVGTALFCKGKPAYALSVIFAGILAGLFATEVFFVKDYDTGRYAKEFAEEVASFVPASGELAAYRGVPMTFVQYYGKTIPLLEDRAALEEAYAQGKWIFCRRENIATLENPEQFRVVYSKGLELKLSEKTDGGIIMHKDTPVVYDVNPSLLD